MNIAPATPPLDNGQNDNTAFCRWFVRETALLILTAVLGFFLFVNVMACVAPFTQSPWSESSTFDFIGPVYAFTTFVLAFGSAYLSVRTIYNGASRWCRWCLGNRLR